MSAWDDVQTEPVKEIEAAIFRQMEGRSNSDPCSPWADLALALCQRLAAETKLREKAEAALAVLAANPHTLCDEHIARLTALGREANTALAAAEARATRAKGALVYEQSARDFANACCASDAAPHATCCNDAETGECRLCLTARATRAEGALRRSALSLAEEAERTADTAEEDGLKKGFRLPHLRNAAAKVRAALSPSLDAPCPHPARGGHHEVYADGSGFLCRACGARALAGEAQKEGTNG
jgi:hypothetical protein